MYKTSFEYLFLLLSLLFFGCQNRQTEKADESCFLISSDDAKPWVYWFLADASISKKGITTDLEAMKENGIGGAFLFTIRGAANPSLFEPTVVQLTSEWWDMMQFAVSEANRLGLKLGIHACDGFTAAGGPWITPELSMQKVVWTDTLIPGNQHFEGQLSQPETVGNYYEDIATFAYPAPAGNGVSSYEIFPKVTTSLPVEDASFIAIKGNTKNFTSREKCWIQYSFDEPFTCRSITLQSGWNNYQANRLILETSNDGITFQNHGRLKEYRHGWDDRNVTVTHMIEPNQAKYFRFVFDPDGTEPGAEDLDDAKWRPRLVVSGIELSGEAKIDQFEGKTGAAWRISQRTNPTVLPESECIDLAQLIDISEFLGQDGKLSWDVPEGDWVILRMGHTSTGATNYIGGGGVGLEADKLNPVAVKIQFENWFDSIYNHVGDLAENTIEELYNDSWECGSQNWSPVLFDEFKQRRGYDLKSFLPVMAGVPIKNAGLSEQVLYDIRETIAETLADNYHGTMKKLAHEKGVRYSSESVAPVFVSDGMLHFKNTDAPTGEFWFRSPSHDKPNDILDAVSGAHIYGKKLVRAEAGTEIRLDWDEHPGILKTLFDRNFALGVNKMIFHVFTHDPWTDRVPGKTLGVVGNFFQPNQTWWKPGKAWIKYIENCQAQLQQGTPVADIAVFAGEEIPRRAVLPDRLVPVLPGIYGEERVQSEKERLENAGQPFRELPAGVTTEANISDPSEWTDPLKGYAYDSFNKDALLNLASVKDGKIMLPGGACYSLLVIPGKRKMNPEGDKMSVEVAKKILQLAQDGATVLIQHKPGKSFNYYDDPEEFAAVINQLFPKESTSLSENLTVSKVGKGRIILGTWNLASFEELGIERDFFANENGFQAQKLAWNHRSENGKEIYFISNQEEQKRELELSFRVEGKAPELYFPVSDERMECGSWRIEQGLTLVPISVEANESFFVIFEKPAAGKVKDSGSNREELVSAKELEGPWTVQFEAKLGGPVEPVVFEQLTGWETNKDERIKYYSGTAVYLQTFDWSESDTRVWLDVGKVDNLAEVIVNSKSCGVTWTAPFLVEITAALRQGENQLEIAVTNTWANRLIGDFALPESERITWTPAAERVKGKSLLPAGLLGPVVLMQIKS